MKIICVSYKIIFDIKSAATGNICMSVNSR
jgi:hypothetical protein